MAAGERRVNAITRAPDTQQVLGERLTLGQRMSETRAEARALRAEARQIRGKRRTKPADQAIR